VTQYRPFFIVGQVRNPGQYPYLGGLTVWNAIATAQGMTPRGRDPMSLFADMAKARKSAIC
jgi:polysaccharide export outer membrane protein